MQLLLHSRLLLHVRYSSAFRQLPELTNASSSGIISIAPETFGELHGSLGTHGPEACGEPEIRLRTHGPEQMTPRMSDRLLEFIPHGIPERMPERNVRIDGRKDVR